MRLAIAPPPPGGRPCLPPCAAASSPRARLPPYWESQVDIILKKRQRMRQTAQYPPGGALSGRVVLNQELGSHTRIVWRRCVCCAQNTAAMSKALHSGNPAGAALLLAAALLLSQATLGKLQRGIGQRLHAARRQAVPSAARLTAACRLPPASLELPQARTPSRCPLVRICRPGPVHFHLALRWL